MFNTDNTVMVLVDVQGKLARLMHHKEALYENMQKLLRGLKIMGVPIIWMEQMPENLGPTIEEISCILTDLKPIGKRSFSCWASDSFVERFKAVGRTEVLVAGIETHICVYQTAVDLVKNGNRVKVVSDCVSSRTEINKKTGLKMIRDTGCHITSTEAILFELMRTADDGNFRDVIKIIK